MFGILSFPINVPTTDKYFTRYSVASYGKKRAMTIGP